MNGVAPPATAVHGSQRTRRALLHDLARLASGVAGLALLESCAPTPAPAGPTRVNRVGVLSNVVDTPFPEFPAFWDRLRELGYVDGKNLSREQRAAPSEQAPEPVRAELVAELARLPVDVMVITNGPPSQIAVAATTSIPVVLMRSTTDPVAVAQVESLAHPGGNITGLAGAPTADLDVKRVELLVEAAPGISRIAVLGVTPNFARDPWRSASASFGVEFLGLPGREGPVDFEAAFERARAEGANALLVRSGRGTGSNGQLIGRLAEAYRLPAVTWSRRFVTPGALMAYEPRQSEVERRAAEYVDRILRGAPQADLPMELPTRYDLVVNMRSARALGLTLGRDFLDQVTELIE